MDSVEQSSPAAGRLATVQIAPGAEPLPGYHLLEPLGRGGFGEVWKCEAPGGLHKAIKFVSGIAEESTLGSPAALEQEALQRIKAIRHPYLLSIERIEAVPGLLMIVMELADQSLHGLFNDYRAQGRPGIPRQQLLALLLEAAEALDLLNLQHNLQHLDVKPHNLFVVSNHAKVADFGLVRSLQGGDATASRRCCAATPLYAAPELFQGNVHRRSDQYSLAIVYQQLLTGRLPYGGRTPYELMHDHLFGTPHLEALPSKDQAVVARALARNPEDRFSSCLEFIEALARLTGSKPVPVLPRSVQPGAATNTPPGRETTPTRVLSQVPLAPLAGDKTVVRPSAAAQAPEELLPGYQVLACQGQGPLGDFWSVRAADGRERLALRLTPLADATADVARRLQGLTHAGLAPVEVAINPAGCVVLLSDPGPRSLRERFEECRAAGQPGIPRAELLAHLRAAAQTLDELAREPGLSHLLVSPANVLLEEGRTLLRHFGLVPLVWLAAGKPAGTLNPRYAAPELAAVGGGPAADQYSLALIYAEMLTGLAPRPVRHGSRSGTARRGAERTPMALNALPIDLDFLPATDRPVLAKALRPDPNRRFASCTEFVRVLEAATVPAPQESAVLDLLPPVVPVGALLGKPGPDTPVPPLAEVVADLVERHTGVETVGDDPNTRYHRHAEGWWELRCKVQALPGMLPLKLEGVRQQWQATAVPDTVADIHAYRIPTNRGRWRLWGSVQEAGLEVIVQAVSHGGTAPLEALVRAQPYGPLQESEAATEKLVARVFTSLRAFLQPQRELRLQERWPFPQRLRVYPILPLRGAVEVVEAHGRDISRGGLAFTVPHALPSAKVYLHLHESCRADLALRARVVRSERGSTGYDIGVTFDLERPQPNAGKSPWEWAD